MIQCVQSGADIAHFPGFLFISTQPFLTGTEQPSSRAVAEYPGYDDIDEYGEEAQSPPMAHQHALQSKRIKTDTY